MVVRVFTALVLVGLVGCSSDLNEKELDRRLAPHVARARERWPEIRDRFKAGLPKEQELHVLVRLREGREYWHYGVHVLKLDPPRIVGKLTSSTSRLPSYRVDDSIVTSETEILDWSLRTTDRKRPPVLEGRAVEHELDLLGAEFRRFRN